MAASSRVRRMDGAEHVSIVCLAILRIMEIIFEVRDAEEGGFWARALGHSIFTQAEIWDELRAMVQDATSLHFEDNPEQPTMIQLHYIKDELIPVRAA